MGRPSKLTEVQWEQIGKRLLKGETASSLAKEYGVDKAGLTRRFSQRNATIKATASKLAEAESAMALLNISEQIAARSLADDLKAITQHLAGAARFSAATAHRLAGIANSKAAEIDDASPLSDEKSIATLRGVAVLTKMANESSEIGVNLLRANKEEIDRLNQESRRQRDPARNVARIELVAMDGSGTD